MRNRGAGTGRSQVSKGAYRRQYPKNWDSITSKVDCRDDGKCFFCKKDRAALKRLTEYDGIPRRLETHHLQSVQTGNNRKTNLVKICSMCHAKQPGHEHLMARMLRYKKRK